jgi:hypothetical protein
MRLTTMALPKKDYKAGELEVTAKFLGRADNTAALAEARTKHHIDQAEYTFQVAKKCFVSWNLKDENDRAMPLNEFNIRMLLNLDETADIIEKIVEEIITDTNKAQSKLEEEEKN